MMADMQMRPGGLRKRSMLDDLQRRTGSDLLRMCLQPPEHRRVVHAGDMEISRAMVQVIARRRSPWWYRIPVAGCDMHIVAGAVGDALQHIADRLVGNQV